MAFFVFLCATFTRWFKYCGKRLHFPVVEPLAAAGKNCSKSLSIPSLRVNLLCCQGTRDRQGLLAASERQDRLVCPVTPGLLDRSVLRGHQAGSVSAVWLVSLDPSDQLVDVDRRDSRADPVRPDWRVPLDTQVSSDGQ